MRSFARFAVYVLTIVVAVSVLYCAYTRTHDGYFDDLRSLDSRIVPLTDVTVMPRTADLANLLETVSRKYVSASPIAAVLSQHALVAA